MRTYNKNKLRRVANARATSTASLVLYTRIRRRKRYPLNVSVHFIRLPGVLWCHTYPYRYEEGINLILLILPAILVVGQYTLKCILPHLRQVINSTVCVQSNQIFQMVSLLGFSLCRCRMIRPLFDVCHCNCFECFNSTFSSLSCTYSTFYRYASTIDIATFTVIVVDICL